MIYEAAVPVSHTRHLNWSVEVGTDYAFCRNVNAVPLMAAEFASAACEYAIVLGGTGDVVMPVAVLGARPDQNLYVTSQGGDSLCGKRAQIPAAIPVRIPAHRSALQEAERVELARTDASADQSRLW